VIFYAVESTDGVNLRFVLGTQPTWSEHGLSTGAVRRFFALDGSEYPVAPASSWMLLSFDGYETVDAARAALNKGVRR